MKFFNLLHEMFSGADQRLSSKRVTAFICLLMAIVFAFIALLVPGVNVTIALSVFGGFLTSFTAGIGIASLDTNSFFRSVYGHPQVIQSEPRAIGFIDGEANHLIADDDDNEFEEDKLQAHKLLAKRYKAKQQKLIAKSHQLNSYKAIGFKR